MIFRIGRSKEPTLSRLQRMAHNLGERTGDCVFVTVSGRRYSMSSEETHFEMSLVNSSTCYYHKQFKSWQELQNEYFRLMKKGTNP